MRILVAGVGNVLNGDDGFGVEVIRALENHPFPEGVVLTETGIGGIALVQDLMLGYDACIIVDAVDHGRPPGTVLVIEPEVLDVHTMRAEQRHDLLADMHLATPSRALLVAQGLGCLPARRVIVGCQPEEIETLAIGLTATVQSAIPFAIAEIDRCIREWNNENNEGLLIDVAAR
jgi:hydrogenase maturation protease